MQNKAEDKRLGARFDRLTSYAAKTGRLTFSQHCDGAAKEGKLEKPRRKRGNQVQENGG